VRLSTITPDHGPEELFALRRLIGELAPQCGLDLADRAATRHFLDGQASHSESIDPQLCQELRAMLILLFRLEACSSEDSGLSGMRRLWRLHGETLARFAGKNA
jgi:hypothetical protein